jgi:putative ABC transport system permease protein
MILQNLRYSVRALRRTPLITSLAVATLALGIGANTALFSVINTVLLRLLSYPNPERIVELLRQFPDATIWATTATKFAFWRDGNQHKSSALDFTCDGSAPFRDRWASREEG